MDPFFGWAIYLGSCASRSADKRRIIEIEADKKVLEDGPEAGCPLDRYRQTLPSLRNGSMGHLRRCC